jgi:hypothetical protein
MRGIAKLVTGLVFVSIAVLLMGTLLEPVTAIVIDNAVMQSLGWDTIAIDVRDTILRYVPLLFIGILLAFAGAVAFRKGRVSNVRQR